MMQRNVYKVYIYWSFCVISVTAFGLHVVECYMETVVGVEESGRSEVESASAIVITRSDNTKQIADPVVYKLARVICNSICLAVFLFICFSLVILAYINATCLESFLVVYDAMLWYVMIEVHITAPCVSVFPRTVGQF